MVGRWNQPFFSTNMQRSIFDIKTNPKEKNIMADDDEPGDAYYNDNKT